MLSLSLLLISFVCMCVWSVCTSVHQLHAWCPQNPKEGAGSLEPELEMVLSTHVGAGN